MAEKSLLDIVKKYNFAKHPGYPDTDFERPNGFGNMVSSIGECASMIIADGYNREFIDTMYRAYGFLAACYSSIDFKELEQYREHPEVERFFITNALIRDLGNGINNFATTCLNNSKKSIKITEETAGYSNIQETIKRILDNE